MAKGKNRVEWDRMSALMALIANCNRDPKARPEPFRPSDFNPFADPESRKPIQANINVLKMFVPK